MMRELGCSAMKAPQAEHFGESGRGDRIRTCDIYVPNVALYQSELHPEYRRMKPIGAASVDQYRLTRPMKGIFVLNVDVQPLPPPVTTTTWLMTAIP